MFRYSGSSATHSLAYVQSLLEAQGLKRLDELRGKNQAVNAAKAEFEL